MDSEIRRALDRVLRANGNLRKEKTEDHREIVCVETRAAYGTLEDVCYWAKRVDKEARRETELAIKDAVGLLENKKDDVYLAVLKRLELVRELTTEKIRARLAAHS